MSQTFVNLGRRRGEFERATKKLMQAHNGVRHPKDLGFIAQADLADRMCSAMVLCNGIAKEGRLQRGVPDERWIQSTLANPLRALAPEHLWLFLPERRELQIRQGHVLPELHGEVLPFCHPELFAQLGNGYRVIVHFDPTEPSLGAAILNGEAPEASRNVEAWPVGQVLGIADQVPFAPQFAPHASFSPTAEFRKRYHAWNAAAYRGTGLYGRRAGKTDEARDGAGNVARIESGPNVGRAAAPAAPAPDLGRLAATPPPRTRRDAFDPLTPEVAAARGRVTADLTAALRELRGEPAVPA